MITLALAKNCAQLEQFMIRCDYEVVVLSCTCYNFFHSAQPDWDRYVTWFLQLIPLKLNNPTTPKYPPVLVRCIHQSMSIRITLSPELRVLVPTVGVIKVVFRKGCTQNNISTVTVPNLNWQTRTLDKSNIRPLTIIGGVLGVMSNCCSHSPQESPGLPSHCTITVTISEAFTDWDSMLYQITLMSGMHQLEAIHM